MAGSETGKEKKSITNITIDTELKKRLQVYCIMNEISMSEVIEKLVGEFLKDNKY